MHRKKLVAGNRKFLKNVVPIYILSIIIFISAINHSSITNITLAGPYSGPDYYVNGTSGSDSNNGSFNYPWKTIQKAVNTLTVGQTVYIMAGVYNEYITPWSGMKSGTPGNWITYTNYQNDEAILDGTGGTDDWTALIRMDNQKYIRFSNLIFRNSSCHGILAHDGEGTAHNITIDNCTFYNISAAAIDIKGYNAKTCDILIENNIIYDAQNGWNHVGEPPDECITVSNVNRFIIRNNIMYNNHKINIDAKAGSQNGAIYKNRINTKAEWVCRWGIQGIYIDAQNTNCKTISLYNNIIWGNGTGFEFGTEKGGTLDNIKIYNNIYNGTQNAFQINNHTGVPGSHLKTNLMFINNVVSGAVYGFQITDKNTSFKNLTVRNNIIKGNAGFYIPGGLKLQYHNVDHNLYNVATSNYYGANSINGSPCFADPANGNYRLLSNSPAIDAGSSDSAPLVDFDGVSRPQGSEVDIGAFEYHSEYDTTPPTPNPSTWTTLPYKASSTSISMTATTATDPSGGIQYYFDETSGNSGGTDSGWQSSSTYTDIGLTTGSTYTYRLQTRDALQNTGSWSTSQSVTLTTTDTTPPTPNPSTWATVPYKASSTSISMTATTATDPSGGIQYYFDETSGNAGGTDSGWQSSSTYTDTGLTTGSTYTYRLQKIGRAHV